MPKRFDEQPQNFTDNTFSRLCQVTGRFLSVLEQPTGYPPKRMHKLAIHHSGAKCQRSLPSVIQTQAEHSWYETLQERQQLTQF